MSALLEQGLLAPLRPYQLEAARAIVGSVRRRLGLSFSVEVARQGGKNELSARIELLLLLQNAWSRSRTSRRRRRSVRRR